MVYKVGKISFINFLPLSLGKFPFECKKFVLPPSSLNNLCRRGELDISPISYQAYSDLKDEYELLPDICIAAEGKIKSVKIFSNCQLEEICGKKIYITDESETSAYAFKTFCKKKLGFNVDEFRCSSIEEADVIFLIGDKALSFGGTNYEYDFGTLWKESFGTPLLYARIAVKKTIYDDVKDELILYYEKSLKEFFENSEHYLKIATSTISSENFTLSDAEEYFSMLKYCLDEDTMSKCEKIFI